MIFIDHFTDYVCIHHCHLHNSQGVGTGPADLAIVGPTKVS